MMSSIFKRNGSVEPTLIPTRWQGRIHIHGERKERQLGHLDFV